MISGNQVSACKQIEKDRTYGEYVAFLTIAHAFEHFRGNIAWGTTLASQILVFIQR